jgi:hypothetical protein
MARIAKVLFQIVLLCLKSCTASSHKDLMKSEVSPEFSLGIVGRVLYLWINPILVKASHRLLRIDDLPCLDEEISTIKAEIETFRAWKLRSKASL